jgi:copper transport protein
MPKRWSKRGALTLLLGILLSLLPGGPVLAHTEVDEYQPSTGAVVATTPETITLRFTVEPDPNVLTVKLLHRDGREVPFTGEGPDFDDRTVTLHPPALDLGTYVIIWEAVGADGHIAAGQSHFSVGVEEQGLIADFTPQSRTGSNLLETITRFALYGVIALLLGLVLLRNTALLKGDYLSFSKGLGGIAVLLWLIRLLMVADRAGGREGLATGAGRILTTMPGTFGWALFLAGALLLLARNARWVLLVAATLVALGDTLAGHMGTSKNAGVLSALTTLHLLGASLWVGGIVVMLLLGNKGRRAFVEFTKRFTPWAFGSAGIVVLSGVVLTLLRTKPGIIEDFAGFFSYQYGQQLAAKWVLLLLVVLPLGGYHMVKSIAPRLKRLLSPEQAAGTDDHEANTSETTAGETGLMTRKVGIGFTFGLEAIALAVVLLLGSSLAGLSPVKPAKTESSSAAVDLLARPTDFSECMGPEEATNQLLCATRYFEGIVETRGMNAALIEVGDRWREGDSWMQTNCHSIGHKLGRLGFRMFKDIPTAFSQGSDPCDYGYLHGVIEGASADFSDDELREAMTTMCEGTGSTDNHGYRQCIHGLGHAAARRVNNDLARGMEFCREFGEPSADALVGRDSGINDVLFRLCVTGVSMEWNTQPKALDAMKLPIGAEGTLMGECIKLDEIFQFGCIEYGTSAMGGILEREIEARNWCDKNLAEPLPCYQSIGRDVIWSPTISREEAVEVCTGGKQGIYAEQCIIRALGSVATIALDADAIDEFCPVLPEQYKKLCPEVKAVMKVQIDQTVRGFITEPAKTDGSGA